MSDIDGDLAKALQGLDRASTGRALRRAARRGVVRTGVIAGAGVVAWAIAGVLVLMAASGLWFRGAGLRSGFRRVGEPALAAAYPGWEVRHVDCCAVGLGLNASMRVDLVERRASGVGEVLTIHLHQDFRGRYHNLPRVDTSPVAQAIGRGRPTKAATRAVAASIPDGAVALAVVEWGDPRAASKPGQTRDADDPHPGDAEGVTYFSDPYGPSPTSWPTGNAAELRAWASSLNGSDNRNLRRLSLPRVTSIRSAAASGRAHATVRAGLTRASILALLDDPAVRSVNIADIDFALEAPRT